MRNLPRPLVITAVALLILLARSCPGTAGAIHDAIVAGEVDRVAQLLREDPSLASDPLNNDTRDLPLHTAAIQGNLEIARLLIEAGADIDGYDVDESTPLDVAALRQQSEIVALLLANGADANRRDKNGACPVSFAAFSGDMEIVRQLIAAGADLNYTSTNGTNLLHAACYRGLDELLDLIIERGGDVEKANFAGLNAVHWACMGGHVPMVERLLEMGASPTAPDTTGATPLLKAVERNQIDVVRLLLEHDADPNTARAGEVTPLHGAIWRENMELVDLLLQHSADVNYVNKDNRSALWWAVQNGDPAIIDLLLAAGANTEIRDEVSGRAVLHEAVRYGHGDVVSKLLDAGASIKPRDRSGKMPIWYANRYGHQDVAEQLVRKGASPISIDPNRGLASRGELANKEALVWHLGHSGWAIQTANHLLIFDYAEMGHPADDPGLCNGSVNMRELGDQNVTVFVSHEHGDHFDPAIFGWRDGIEDLTYVFGFRPETGQPREGLPDPLPPYEFIAPRETRTIDGMKVMTIESNDSGVGFVVEVDGVSIFHPGDHANRHRDFSGTYKPEIEYLKTSGVRPDIAFMPISGCGFRDLEAVRLGVEYTIAALEPHVFLPMHGGNEGWRYLEFLDRCEGKFPETQLHACENRGDCFHFKNGRAS